MNEKAKYLLITADMIRKEECHLSSDHRAVLLAATSHNTYVAIAQELGLKVGTVKSRLNRARKVLLARLEAA